MFLSPLFFLIGVEETKKKKKNQSSIQRTIGKEIKQNSRVNSAKFVISEIKAQTTIILFFLTSAAFVLFNCTFTLQENVLMVTSFKD
jgi:hypothetical protein